MEGYIYLSSISYLLGDSLAFPLKGSSKKYINKERIDSYENLIKYSEIPYLYSNDYAIFLASLDSLLIGFSCDDLQEKYLSLIKEGKYKGDKDLTDINPSIRRSVERHFIDGIPSYMSGGIKNSENGNGVLFRGLAFFLYLYRDKMDLTEKEIFDLIDKYSSVSHQHFKSKISLGIFGMVVFSLIDNYKSEEKKDIKDIVKESIKKAYNYYKNISYISYTMESFERIFSDDFFDIDKNELRGGAFVIDTLENILYSLGNSTSFEDSMIKALSFGKDTSANVGLTCGLSSLYYGLDNKYDKYIKNIKNIHEIKKLVNEFGGRYES